MKLLRSLFVALVLSLPALPAAAQALSLAEISAYLNALVKVEAAFTQINDDGTISTGRIYIWRPGRIRFEYDPPEESLVVAGRGQVAVFDARSNQPPEMFQLGLTPLSLILGPEIDLTREEMVVGFESDGTATSVVLQDPKYPEYGNIRLIFTADPVQLRQWVTTDSAGQTTTVILRDLKERRSFRLELFDIDREAELRGF
jgi:outer membrane lipoprotein-sorting protein